MRTFACDYDINVAIRKQIDRGSDNDHETHNNAPHALNLCKMHTILATVFRFRLFKAPGYNCAPMTLRVRRPRGVAKPQLMCIYRY